jgi:cell division septum initiation protein DivIVA
MSEQKSPWAGRTSKASPKAEELRRTIASIPQGSGSAYQELAGRLAVMIQGIGTHAERLLTEAEAEAEQILTDAREEADQILTQLADRRDAMLAEIRLLDERLGRVTSEVETMIETMASEHDDMDASAVEESEHSEHKEDSPLVIPESGSADVVAAPSSPTVVEPKGSEGNQAIDGSSLYDALWGPYDGANLRPDDSPAR